MNRIAINLTAAPDCYYCKGTGWHVIVVSEFRIEGSTTNGRFVEVPRDCSRLCSCLRPEKVDQ